MFSQLYTNADGRLSTTAFIQFFGAILMAVILCFCAWVNHAMLEQTNKFTAEQADKNGGVIPVVFVYVRMMILR